MQLAMQSGAMQASPPASGCAASASSVDLYRPVEKQFKASATPAHGKRARKQLQRRRRGAGDSQGDEGENAYAADFERWRSEAIDCATPALSNNTHANRARIVAIPWAAAAASTSSLPPRWLSPSARLYALVDQPGFYIIRGALDANAQAWWAWRALDEYSRRPHTNLTNLHQLQAKEKMAAQQAAGADAVAPVESAAAPQTPPLPGPDHPDRNLWRAACAKQGDFSQLPRLRWASLGDIYDWTARQYVRELCDPFPAELGQMTEEMAREVAEATRQFSLSAAPQDASAPTSIIQPPHFSSNPLRAEAALVNYYPCSASMGGHVDDAEDARARHAPIVSISLGCTAVFLIGGATRSEKAPTAVYLRSGDICVMGGQSRMAVHGVPRVLERTFAAPIFEPEDTEQDGTHEADAPSIAMATSPNLMQQQSLSEPDLAAGLSPSPLSEGPDEKKQRCDDGPAAVDAAGTCSQAVTAASAPSSRRASTSAQPPFVWSAERCFDELRTGVAVAGADAAPAASSASPVFPAGLPAPTCTDLLHVFRFLRQSRINLNVRQVRPDSSEPEGGAATPLADATASGPSDASFSVTEAKGQ